jgi:hypothetical protein
MILLLAGIHCPLLAARKRDAQRLAGQQFFCIDCPAKRSMGGWSIRICEAAAREPEQEQ